MSICTWFLFPTNYDWANNGGYCTWEQNKAMCRVKIPKDHFENVDGAGDIAFKCEAEDKGTNHLSSYARENLTHNHCWNGFLIACDSIININWLIILTLTMEEENADWNVDHTFVSKPSHRGIHKFSIDDPANTISHPHGRKY